MKEDLLFPDEAYEIIGACFEVYNTMGYGFLESVYQECLELELAKRGIPTAPHEKLSLAYKGTQLKSHYIPDFICYEQIIVEIKSSKSITREHQAQAFNYLKASGLSLALLVNFGTFPELEHRRIAFTQSKSN